MIYAICLSPFGEVFLDLDTMKVSGFFVYIRGHDCNHNHIDFVMDRFMHLEDYATDYGWCHIVSYTTDGITTPCNLYRTLS